MNRKVFSLMVVALGGMFLAATAWAQNSTGTVEAIGIQRVRVQPKAIRFVYLIQASGKTPEGAVKLLQIQRDAALPKLKELGAQGDSIHSTPVALATGYPQAYNPYYTAPVYGTPATPYYAPPAPANYGPPAMNYDPPPGGESTPAAAPSYPTPAPNLVPSSTVPPDGSGGESSPQAEPVAPPATYAASTLPPPSYPSTVNVSGVATDSENDISSPFQPPAAAPAIITAPPPGIAVPAPAPAVPREPAPVFIAQTILTAEWPIGAGKPDEMALNVEKLRKKLVATLDLAQALQRVYVGELSQSDCKTALAAATAKAKDQAAALAEAAGCHLGPLASVSAEFQDGSPGPTGESLTVMLPNGGDLRVSNESREVTVRVTLHFHIAP